MKKQRGFTLVELMITLVIASIVLTMAVPGMRDLIQNNRITGQVNEMVTAFNLARLEAIRRGTPVSVCASTDQENCSTDATNWPKGWIVFVDTNATGNPADPALDQRIRVWDQLPGNPTINAGAFYVRYQSNGTTGASFTFDHTIPDCSGMQKRKIRITAGGRVGGVTREPCP